MKLMIQDFNVIHNRQFKDDLLYTDAIKENKKGNIVTLARFTNMLKIYIR